MIDTSEMEGWSGLAMTIEIQWDNGEKTASVSSATELDEVLNRIEAQRGPTGLHFVVDITKNEEHRGMPVGLHMSVGHPDRARVFWIGPGDGVGYEPGVTAWDGKPIEFDYGHLPTEEDPNCLRVTPVKAREAARQFVETGERPTCLAWGK
ncbi:Imm1 family immunity protein [Krasilnikovia sp. MM14-A1004]|uniref:Imm1 family immunity protein n=1 Tax=Krasilnikovia sp. MM14-A1004 TaxID=3373541 RepID=UPI00399CCD3D